MSLLFVNHHYFRSRERFRGIYPTTPNDLRNEVSNIRAMGWRIGTEQDIFEFLKGATGVADKVCILTFDDGLREQMHALKLLSTLNATAIFYVPTKPLIDGRVLDVHKLHMIRERVTDRQLCDELCKRFHFNDYEFDDVRLENQYRYDDVLSRKIKFYLNFVLEARELKRWLSEYFESLFGDERRAAEQIYMNKDDICELAKYGMLGSHAHSHRPLATLDPRALEEELQRSRLCLKDLSGVAPLGISYPYGGKTAVNQMVFECAKASGYEYGLTMERGCNTNPLCTLDLMRIDVNDLSYWLSNMQTSHN